MSANAIYHRVYAHENFETAAHTLHRLVVEAQKKFPDAPRHLYLDIDGHRNSEGGFDPDMFELQRHFVLGFLAEFLTEINIPLGEGAIRTKSQRNDVPEILNIGPETNK